MKILYSILSLLGFTLIISEVSAQTNWPKIAGTPDGGQVKVYQWQPESLNANVLKARAAISIQGNGETEPTFGMIWIDADAETAGQQIIIQSARVTNLKLPGLSDETRLEHIRSAIEESISDWGVSFSSSDLQSEMQMNEKQDKLAERFNNNPPKICYRSRPSLLVVIDGSPRIQRNSELGVEMVVNTPFTIVKDEDGQFYLYGGKHWYKAPSATGPYTITTNVSSTLTRVENEVNNTARNNSAKAEENDYTISDIVVSTEPAELIQSNGDADFAPIEGTNLLYVKNSDNDIFMDINSQQYFVLLSGRWYHSRTLGGKWQYVASDKLPQDFSMIPEGSPKDNVLASVAGTPPAKDALLNEEVPQTAKVNRHTAKANVTYDGEPRFEDIEGTNMKYAVNSPNSVILYKGVYYTVDNGVWFQSYDPEGPWTVAETRPYPVALIPPQYPVYNMKYVYVYDYTPDYVYAGYTPGYLNAFVYGPTVVYGTGYYYYPWYGHYYYPRPYTWGFGMQYNPWIGWGFSFNFNFGWFNIGFGSYYPWGYYGYYGGWWGPPIYHPPYCRAGYPYHGYGYYGGYYGGYHGGYYGYNSRTNVAINNNVNIYHTNNIYNFRRDAVTRDNRPMPSNNGRQFLASNNGSGRRAPFFRQGQQSTTTGTRGFSSGSQGSSSGQRPVFGPRNSTSGRNVDLGSGSRPMNSYGGRKFAQSNGQSSQRNAFPNHGQGDSRRPSNISNGQRERDNVITSQRQRQFQQPYSGRSREFSGTNAGGFRQEPSRSSGQSRSFSQGPRSFGGGGGNATRGGGGGGGRSGGWQSRGRR